MCPSSSRTLSSLRFCFYIFPSLFSGSPPPYTQPTSSTSTSFFWVFYPPPTSFDSLLRRTSSDGVLLRSPAEMKEPARFHPHFHSPPPPVFPPCLHLCPPCRYYNRPDILPSSFREDPPKPFKTPPFGLGTGVLLPDFFWFTSIPALFSPVPTFHDFADFLEYELDVGRRRFVACFSPP